jgi:hypothetical protein
MEVPVVERAARPLQTLVVGRCAPDDLTAEQFARRVGDWGGASAQLGRRWEELGAEALRALLPLEQELGKQWVYRIEAVLDFDSHPGLHEALSRAGLSAPDLVLIGRMGSGRLVVQPADCKVSLDTADPAQVAGSRLADTLRRAGRAVRERLLEQGALSAAERALVEAVLSGRNDPGVLLTQGLFIAPDTAFNRRVQQRAAVAPGRSGKAAPSLPGRSPAPGLAASLVSLRLPVAPEKYLEPLPHWPEAELLLELDGVPRAGIDPGILERYYRLGAGIAGGLRLLATPLFAPLPEGWQSLPEVEAFLRRGGFRSTAQAIAALHHRREARVALVQRRRTIERCPYRFANWREDTAAAGLDWNDPQTAGRLAPLYRQVAEQHRERIMQEGAALVAAGMGEEQALAALEGRMDEWLEAAQSDALWLLDEYLTGSLEDEAGEPERSG